MQEIIEKIGSTVEKKKVQSLCKKILKKCNLKSQNDLANLLELATWLYIYGRLDDAMAVCDLLTGLAFTGNYTLWSYTDNALCLKARILREKGDMSARDALVQKANEHRHPELYANLVDWYRGTLNRNIKNEDANHPNKINHGWRMDKLNFAIRYQEAGGHPIPDEEFEADIQEIVTLLKQVK